MSSVRDDRDLTLRARIRDSAIALFGAEGFDHVTVRQIARRAGASPALVLHHFGSKAGLRQECDDYVVSTLLADRGALIDGQSADGVATMLAGAGVYRERLDYLARLVIDPGAAGERVFDAFLEHTRRMMTDAAAQGSVHSMDEPEVTALLLTAYGLAPLLLHHHLARSLGADPLSPAGAELLAVPGLELFTRGLYRDDALLTSAKEALARRSGPRSDKGDGDPNQDPDPPSGLRP